MSNAVNINNIKQVYDVGLKALTNALGNVGAVRFLMQFDIGTGDYTKERESMLDGITLKDIVKELDV